MLNETTSAPAQAPLLIAHRGASAVAPENTIAAFEIALEQGANGLDIDVQLSADGHPVVIQDTTLERTTDGSGPVQALTLRELKRLDAGGWRGSRFRGQRVQGLGEVFERFRERARFWLRVDGSGRYPGIEERVVSLLEIYELLDRCLVQSPQLDTLTEIRRLNPAISVGLLVSGAPLNPFPSAPGSIQAVCPAAALLAAATVATIRAAGLACYAWTVDEPALASRLAAWGVDGIATSQPGVIRAAIGR